MSKLKMPEINCVMIAGNLTRDPFFRTTVNNTPVVNFTIASNRKFKDSTNQWQEDVCYVGIVAWNKLAESCRNRLKKGSAVLVEGELQNKSWKTDDGIGKSVIEVKAKRVQFLNKNPKNPSETENEEQDVFIDDELNNGYVEDSFNKFLTPEESQLIKNNFENKN